MGRKSLAQRFSAGWSGNTTESHRDDRGSHTSSLAPETFKPFLVLAGVRHLLDLGNLQGPAFLGGSYGSTDGNFLAVITKEGVVIALKPIEIAAARPEGEVPVDRAHATHNRHGCSTGGGSIVWSALTRGRLLRETHQRQQQKTRKQDPGSHRDRKSASSGNRVAQ